MRVERIEEILENKKNDDKIAIIHNNNSITYSQLYKGAANICEIIKEKTINSINIGIILPNSINYALAYFSILFSKKTVVPIQPKSTIDEIKNILAFCEIDLIISDSSFLKTADLISNSYKYSFSVYYIDLDKTIIYKKSDYINKSELDKNKIVNNKIAIMLHTSGTTSNSKIVMLSHKNLVSNIESNICSLNLTQNETTLICLPMCFGYCNTAQFLTHIYLGAKIVIMDLPFIPSRFFDIVNSNNVTNTTMVPTMLVMLNNYTHGFNSKSTLKFICFGGGTVSNKMINSLMNKYNSIRFIQTYGLTECSPRVTAMISSLYNKNKIGSVGKPIPNVKIKIEKIDNEFGEILISGPNVMVGYYKNDVLTSKIIEDGWLHSGDIGYLDNDGFLFITGRIKNVIISGGINIFPEEIENIILNIPGINNVLVYGKEHNILGEIPCAKVVLENKKITKNEIKKYCKQKLSDYKIPVEIDFVNKLEKTYTGKLKRKGN